MIDADYVLALAGFDPDQHPRGPDGRFITKAAAAAELERRLPTMNAADAAKARDLIGKLRAGKPPRRRKPGEGKPRDAGGRFVTRESAAAELERRAASAIDPAQAAAMREMAQRLRGESAVTATPKVAEPTKPLSPADDYSTNGTRAKAFKDWFGDWENDPTSASKVVNEKGEPQETVPISGQTSKVVKEGKPVAVYHGTAKGGFSEFDKKYLDAQSLYGPGFYFTEDQAVAESYQAKGEKYRIKGNKKEAVKEFTDRLLQRSKELPPLVNFSDHSPEQRAIQKQQASVRDLIGAAPSTREFRLEGSPANNKAEFGVDTADLVQREGTPETKAVYLNIRNPFVAGDVKVPADVLEKLQTLNEGGQYDLRTLDATGDNVYYALANQGRDKVKANGLLARAGFDGITHIGGTVMGDKKHQVWIAFEPNQIKSVDNRGTFDPNSKDIRLSADDSAQPA